MNNKILEPSTRTDEQFEDMPIATHVDRVARVPVLHLMHSVVETSITNIVADQIKYFGDRKYDWHVGGLHGVSDDEPFSQLGASVVDFSATNVRKTRLPRVVRDYVRENGIKIIHTHTPRTTVVAVLALGARRHTTKIVSTKHLHAVPQERPAWGWVFTLVDRCSTYMPDRVVAVSIDVGDKIMAMPGLRRERVTVIQNAVDIDRYCVPEHRDDCRREFGIAPESPVLGFAGRITQQKRLDLLLDALAKVLPRHPSTRLLIAGDGAEQERLQHHARQLGIGDHVIWAGHRRDIPRLLAAMDIYVQSSVNEGLSLSLLQAMAARKAVVATDVGGTREVVNERTGILIAPGSSLRIAESIIRLLDAPETVATLVRSARKLVDEQFTVHRQMDQYSQLYESVLSSQVQDSSS